MKDLNILEELVLQWSHDKGIIKNSSAMSQTLKAVSEIGELADNVNKGRDCRDDIGDVIVCLINIAGINGYTLGECLEIAYNNIKDRKGYMNKNGVFIKEGDEL